MENNLNKVKRLNFENGIWVTFIILSLLNIFGDNDVKQYINTGNKTYDTKSKTLFLFTVKVGLLIYLYFLIRNIVFLKHCTCNQKYLYYIRVCGSIFLFIGSILILYFQENEDSVTSSPAT